MKLFAIVFVISLLTCNMLLVAEEQLEGGLTINQWFKKCGDYFANYPQAKEKEFQVFGYCASYVCQKYSSVQIGMRIDECPNRTTNGKECVPLHIKSLPYPQCCRFKCFDK